MDNIKIDLKEIESDDMNPIQLAQDRVQWQFFFNLVMKFHVP
jgi:hypothetical protein